MSTQVEIFSFIKLFSEVMLTFFQQHYNRCARFQSTMENIYTRGWKSTCHTYQRMLHKCLCWIPTWTVSAPAASKTPAQHVPYDNVSRNVTQGAAEHHKSKHSNI